MAETIEFRLNGEPRKLTTDPQRTLLWVLRHDLGQTGTKYGCGIGACGACTVVVGKQAVRSCSVQLASVRGQDVLTIEGLARNGALHPLQRAFVDHGALQCGFCTPGQIMNAYGFLQQHPRPTEAEIVRGMEENLCRCGAYPRIVKAILQASEALRGGVR